MFAKEKENLFRIEVTTPIALPGGLYASVRGLVFAVRPAEDVVPVEGRLAGSDAELDNLFDALRSYLGLGKAALVAADWVLLPEGFPVAQDIVTRIACEKWPRVVEAGNFLAAANFAPPAPLPELAPGVYMGSIVLAAVGSMKEALGAYPAGPGAQKALQAALEKVLPWRARVEEVAALPPAAAL